ncbi:hypothetical protein FCM35_KLT10013 [Carex littledalei]|uniref:KIB1-4 beta-propeller domain-containing protein n=1 Tax=Carex littledalei TaxID=544730 RepID=A0A833RH53_9POAL|nr:hypothetical protein FCM35_KLT10013 [Carex littledalei]
MSVRCKPGDDRWDIIGPGHEVCLLLRDHNGVTKIWDISSHKELYVIPPPKYEDMSFGPYLVESCGDILAVCYNRASKATNYKFYIHLLEFGNGKGNPCWVKLSSIGDRILFFDFTLLTGRGFGLRASDFARFKANCIYFVDNVLRIGHVQLINMYDIENGDIYDCNESLWLMQDEP